MKRSSAQWLVWSLVLVIVGGCNCRKQTPKPTLFKEGEACMSNEQCETGLCDGPPVVGPVVCLRKCSTVCLAGEVCVQFSPNNFACQPDKRKLCQPCMADTECAYPSDSCLAVNGEHVCGRDCAFDQSCPEGYRCVNGLGVDGQPKVQQCVPMNASCACLARGDFLQPCEVTNPYGTCGGIKQCDVVANAVVCDAKAPQADVCNGMDDNCDGRIDEDGGTVTCGVGACRRTVPGCAGGSVATCTPGDAGPELCDAIDNDCDGMTDEDFPVQADPLNCGACGRVCMLPHATPKCEMGTCKVDTCDMGWNNCNMMDPDGCESNPLTDVNNCNGCGNVCSSQNATPSCVGGACRFMCNAGWVDLDMNPSNGCEYQCTFMSATDVPDAPNFADANCDGIDGELNNGVFVSPSGLDSNAGTRAAPKRTLSAGVGALATLGKRDLYVAAGTYDEPLELLGLSGVNVAGLYDPSTWRRLSTNTTTVRTGNPALKVDAANNVLVQGFRFEAGDGAGASATSYGGWVTESQGVKLESLALVAGRGADGAPGSDGMVGTPGSPGGNGREGCVYETRGGFGSNEQTACVAFFALIQDTYCPSNPVPPGGGGGASACGFPGGAGGTPSHFDFDIMPVPSGGAGSPAPNGTGSGGSGVPPGVTPGMGSSYYGVDGQMGAAGTNGAAASAGMFGSGGYTPGNGGNGTAGSAGRGGGGGGGGAGGRSVIFASPIANCEAYGSGGGGGGGGGCGGTLGQGGRGAGASIGLFLFNATVTATGLNVRSGNGGNGGRGGTGGTGGNGGAGGTSLREGDQGEATIGGGGGRGGNGGQGGHGGGGAGGSVYGLVKNSGSTWTPVSGVSFMLGTPGSAGPSSGNAGPAGASQLQLTF